MLWIIQNAAGDVVFRARYNPQHASAIEIEDNDPRASAEVVPSTWIVRDGETIVDICPRFPNHPAAELVEDPESHAEYKTARFASRRSKLHHAIAEKYQAALGRGMSYGGKVLQIREQDQLNITAMGNEARWAKAAGAPWPVGFGWRMLDNSLLELATADDCIALALAAKTEVIRLRQNKWRLDDLVDAATSAEELAAIDVDSGW
jgi:hypothetical protein